jgi:hypothetical protein
MAVDDIVRWLVDAVVADVRRQTPWRPGALTLLAELRQAQVPCALVTMSWRPLAAAVVDKLPPGTFAAVVTGVSQTALELCAAFAALAFGVHPLRSESVAWITERRDVLSGLFLVTSVWMYVRAVAEPNARKPRTFIASVVLYVLSLLSKGLGMMLPPALLVLDVFVLRRWNGTWNGARAADGTRRTARWSRACGRGRGSRPASRSDLRVPFSRQIPGS